MLEKHRISVVRFLYRLVEDQLVAEALAEEVFLQAYRSLARSVSPTGYVTWLFRSAIRLAHQDGAADHVGPSLPAGPPGLLVRQAVAALPATQRAAVLMHKYEGFDCLQIGNVLGCPDSVVQHLLQRAYRTLHAKLTGAGAIQNECPGGASSSPFPRAFDLRAQASMIAPTRPLE